MSHNHTFRHTGSYKYSIVLTFVKPKGGEGQKGRLKWPLGFLVRKYNLSRNYFSVFEALVDHPWESRSSMLIVFFALVCVDP